MYVYIYIYMLCEGLYNQNLPKTGFRACQVGIIGAYWGLWGGAGFWGLLLRGLFEHDAALLSQGPIRWGPVS